MNKKYTDQQLLDLANECQPTKLSGAGQSYSLALKIPDLCDEILYLREEIVKLKEYKWKYEDLCK